MDGSKTLRLSLLVAGFIAFAAFWEVARQRSLMPPSPRIPPVSAEEIDATRAALHVAATVALEIERHYALTDDLDVLQRRLDELAGELHHSGLHRRRQAGSSVGETPDAGNTEPTVEYRTASNSQFVDDALSEMHEGQSAATIRLV